MSVAHTHSLLRVPNTTFSPKVAGNDVLWKKVGIYVWNYLESIGRHRGEHAIKHGYY
jgi:hypothetical protein